MKALNGGLYALGATLGRILPATTRPTKSPRESDAQPKPLESEVQSGLKALERVYERNRNILDGLATAPDRAGFLQRDRQCYLDKLNNILSGVLDSYSTGIYSKRRSTISEADSQIREERRLLDDLREKLAFAQPGKGDPRLIDKLARRDHTPDSEFYYHERISYHEARLVLLTAARQECIVAFSKDMTRVYEWDIDARQAEVLLYQANGKSITQAVEVVRIILNVERHLANIRGRTRDPDKLHKYYGIAILTRALVALMYDVHIAEYKERWLPNLEQREQANAKLIAETSALMQTIGKASIRAQLLNNLVIQKNTRTAIKRYKQVLDQRRGRTESARDMLVEDVALALNTFKTMEDALALSQERAIFEQDHLALTNLRPDDLIPLSDDDFGEFYLDISQELSK